MNKIPSYIKKNSNNKTIRISPIEHIYYIKEIIEEKQFKYIVNFDNYHSITIDNKNALKRVLYLICLHEMIKGYKDKSIKDMTKIELSRLLKLYGIRIVMNDKLRDQINKTEEIKPNIYWYQN